MKRYILKPGKTGSEALHLEEIAPRDLQPHEVGVRLHAASLNYRDLIVADHGVGRELVPLSDGAGVVEEVGAAVSHLKKGDRVAGLFFPHWQSGEIDACKFAVARGGEPTDGMLAQYVYGPETSFIEFPAMLSFEEASTLPCAGLTAWNALLLQGKLKAGETVVILGTGGVAVFALQLAKKIGAHVILLSSSDEKLKRGETMGADEGINYREQPDWGKRVMEKTAGTGADLVLDLGGGGTLDRSIEAVRISGRISLVGVLTGFEAKINPVPIIQKSLSVKGIYVGSADMQRQFQRALEINEIHPIIDRVFSFAEVKAAYAYMKAARHFGKIVIRTD